MKYYIILCIIVLITGCQGLSQVEQSSIQAPKPTIENYKLPDSFNSYCEVKNQSNKSGYIATGQPGIKSDNKPINDLATSNPDLWDIMGKSFNIPVPNDKRVEYYKDWYLTNPHHINIVTKRAKPFLFYIYQQVEQRDMPIELVLLPFIESSFDQFAHSHRGGRGSMANHSPNRENIRPRVLKRL